MLTYFQENLGGQFQVTLNTDTTDSEKSQILTILSTLR